MLIMETGQKKAPTFFLALTENNPMEIVMANVANITGGGQVSIAQSAPSWRNYVAHVRADAIELGSAEVAQFMANNPGEFSTEQEAVDAYRADHAFLCPVLGHWFRYEDGIETRDGWVHTDAPTIGMNDPAFDYGPADEVHAAYEAGLLLMAAE